MSTQEENPVKLVDGLYTCTIHNSTIFKISNRNGQITIMCQSCFNDSEWQNTQAMGYALIPAVFQKGDKD